MDTNQINSLSQQQRGMLFASSLIFLNSTDLYKDKSAVDALIQLGQSLLGEEDDPIAPVPSTSQSTHHIPMF